MPTATYTPLANITLGSSASSVTFSNIPNTYRDLVLVVNGTAGPTNDIKLNFNGSTSGYSWVAMFGQASGPVSNSGSLSYANIHYCASADRYSIITNIMDYSDTNKYKQILNRSGQSAQVFATTNRWENTNAITSIALAPQTGTFASNSVFELYGVIA